MQIDEAFRGKTVLVTGHTGFTGGWLTIWLNQLGARVVGAALPPEGPENLFTSLGGASICEHHQVDIREAAALRALAAETRPNLVIHLAAQALVRRSYREPGETFATNVLGTVNLLDACIGAPDLCGLVMVTTDKVYRNFETPRPYREGDQLGGDDPYSASKAASELVIESYRKHFFPNRAGPALAVARAGNIVGGGDWAEERIVPDIVRSITGGSVLKVRNPEATRPWQHVLAACHAYLTLGAGLIRGERIVADAWNFGPSESAARTVRSLIEGLSGRWNPPAIEFEASGLKEAKVLALDSTRANTMLGWEPVWCFDETIARTAEWYREYYRGTPALELCERDIAAYVKGTAHSATSSYDDISKLA